MPKIRIAYVTHYEPIHDYRFIQSLSNFENIELVVILLTNHAPEKVAKIKNIKIRKVLNQKIPFDDPWQKTYSLFTRMQLQFSQYFYAYKLKRIIDEEKIDIVHTGWVQMEGMVAALSKTKPLLLMPHGSDILLNPDRDATTMKKTKWIISRSDFITCDCEAVKKKILAIQPDYPKDNFLVFPWGVDINMFRPNEKEVLNKPRRLIMTRFFRPVYNIPFFLEVVSLLYKKFPDLEVILIGEGSERGNIEEKIKSLKLNQVVQLRGQLNQEDLAAELQNATLYVSTSLSDGTSVSLLEAMSSGLPCAVSRIPSNLEWVHESQNGILLDPRNSEKTAEDIAKLLNDQTRLNQYGKTSRMIAEKRANWPENIVKLVDLYKAIHEKNESRHT